MTSGYNYAMKTSNDHYKELFGTKVYRLSIDAGFTCPNRDGTVGTGGCIFCSERGSGDFAAHDGSIAFQLNEAKKRVCAKNKGGKYLAYFQAFTNTYASVDVLGALYREALSVPDIVGLVIGTRPDCLSDETVALLGSLAQSTYVSVELGLQTANDETASRINRGYATAVYDDAVRRLKAVGVEVVTHIIIGLPDESGADAVATTRHAAAVGTDGVKFHLLHVLKNTSLEQEWRNGRYEPLSLDEYADILDACIKELPPHTVVHRITGDGDKRSLLAPLWSADKKYVLNYLRRRLNL